jgi:hypothetical protein
MIRPPRPMSHETYGAGGFGLLPTWNPNPMFADGLGQWLCFDEGDNLVVVQATGTRERSRSRPMTGGMKAARFRLGRRERGSDFRILRIRDKLILIQPKGAGKCSRSGRDELTRSTKVKWDVKIRPSISSVPLARSLMARRRSDSRNFPSARQMVRESGRISPFGKAISGLNCEFGGLRQP